MENRKTDSDRKLIIALLQGLQPLDWSRRDNGDLVYLNQAGQKFVLTPPEIEKLSGKPLPEKHQAKPAASPEKAENRSHHRRVPQERNAEIREARNPQGSSAEGTKAEPAEPKELTEKQAPYEANPD